MSNALEIAFVDCRSCPTKNIMRGNPLETAICQFVGVASRFPEKVWQETTMHFRDNLILKIRRTYQNLKSKHGFKAFLEDYIKSVHCL